jgi:hypothetical protein
VANVGGVFVVLISGGFVGVIVSIFEMLLEVWNRSGELEVIIINFGQVENPIYRFRSRSFKSL